MLKRSKWRPIARSLFFILFLAVAIFFYFLLKLDILPLKYLIDHATRTLLEVPTKQLEDFIRVMEEDPATLCPPDQAFEPGQKVRVVAGNLAGVEGEVEMLPNRTFLVISVCGLLRARIQIPRAYVKAI